MRTCAALLMVLTASAACSSKSDGTAARPAEPTPSSAATSASPAPAAPGKPGDPATTTSAPTPAISRDEAQQLLNAWLKAQNDGDFDAYASLYAPRFTGVRRSAERTVRLPREGWLNERKRMFRAPHQVEATELVVSFPAGMAKLRFSQAWRSASYSDRGDKEMLLTRDGDTLRILYEEMLFSQPAQTTTSDDVAAHENYFVIHADVPYAYLGDGVMGRPHGPDLKRVETVATASIAAEDVPSEIAKQVGRTVQVFTRDGKHCGAKLGPLRYVLSVVTYEALGVPMMDNPDATPMSEADIVKGMWELASHLPIGAQLMLDANSACDPKQIAWVRSGDNPISVGTPIDHASHESAAISAVRAHPKYKAIQRAYAASNASATDTWEDASSVSVQAFRLGARTLVSVAIPNAPCTAFAGSLWAMFEVTGDEATLKPLWVRDNAPSSIILMLDEDGDGAPEMLTEDWETTEHRESDGRVLNKMRGDVFVCGC